MLLPRELITTPFCSPLFIDFPDALEATLLSAFLLLDAMLLLDLEVWSCGAVKRVILDILRDIKSRGLYTQYYIKLSLTAEGADGIAVGPDDVGTTEVGVTIGEDVNGDDVSTAMFGDAVGEGVGVFDRGRLLGLKVGSYGHLNKIFKVI